MKEFFGITATLLTFLSYIPYIRDIFRGKTKPHIYTWLSWSIFGIIIFFTQLQNGGGAGSWMMGSVILMSTVVTLLALKHGTRNITRIDHVTLFLTFVGFVLWILLDSPIYTLIIICCTDMIAFFPTVRKSWNSPETETISHYGISGIKYALSLMALAHYSFETSAYLWLWLGINFLFTVLLAVRRNTLNK